MAFLHMLNLCKSMQKHDLMQLHCCTDAVNSWLFCTKVMGDIYWIKFHHQNEQQTVSRWMVIVITFYSPSCLGQETAKGFFGFRVKLLPVTSLLHTVGTTH